MNAQESEELFEDYLRLHGLEFWRNFPVGSRDIDFRVQSNSLIVLCDVKEVRDSKQNIGAKIDAHTHIRSDIQKLRQKFGKKRPDEPCVLVSMNFSSNFFTGFTVASAMLGDVGVSFDQKTKQIIQKDIRHLARGNAKLTTKQNRAFSGILVFDRAHHRHCLFTNPFAEHPVPEGFFPGVQLVRLTRESSGNDLACLSNLMFWDV